MENGGKDKISKKNRREKERQKKKENGMCVFGCQLRLTFL
tara:strand:+ start:731 stop:850 length:120 start_codon:yes stop_codon:yes gene_type:complete